MRSSQKAQAAQLLRIEGGQKLNCTNEVDSLTLNYF